MTKGGRYMLKKFFSSLPLLCVIWAKFIVIIYTITMKKDCVEMYIFCEKVTIEQTYIYAATGTFDSYIIYVL